MKIQLFSYILTVLYQKQLKLFDYSSMLLLILINSSQNKEKTRRRRVFSLFKSVREDKLHTVLLLCSIVQAKLTTSL